MPPSGNNLMEDEDWQLDCGEIKQRGKRLLASAQWSDCSFLVGPGRESARAHRLILAMASPVFQAMFYGSAAGEASAPIPIPDVQPDVFRKLLQYIYTDDIVFDSYIIAIELYFTAQKYKLKHPLGLCINYLAKNLTPQNSCHIYEFANIIENQMLQVKSLKVIKKNTKLALSDSCFEDLAIGTVLNIFSLDDITIDSELDLLAAAERYFMARNKAFEEMSASNTPSLDILPENNSKTVDVNKNEEKEHEVKVGANGTTENLEDTQNGEDKRTENGAIKVDVDNNEEKEHEVKVGGNGTTENLKDTQNGEDKKTENGAIKVDVDNNEEKKHEVKVGANGTTENLEDTQNGENKRTENGAIKVDVDNNEEKEHEVKVVANGTTENLEDTQNGEDKRTEKNQESSSSATPPQQKEDDRTIFRFTVQNITNLEDRVSSPPSYIGKLPWEIVVTPNRNEQREKQLGVFLYCNSSSRSMSWSCVATAAIILKTQIPNAKQYHRVLSNVYFSHQSNWGYPSFMAWNDVLDPKRGFIKDDSIILEALVIVEELEGLSWGSKKHTRNFKTDDIAVRSVLRKIRFLTLTAKELVEYKPKMSLLTDEDMLALLFNIVSTETQKPMPITFSTCRQRRNSRSIK